MKKLKIQILLLFFIMFSFSSFAQQIKSFSSDPVKFIDELKTFFDAGSSDKKHAKEYIEEFTLLWTTKYSDKYKNACYKTCNMLLKKRLRPSPDFESYLSSVSNFITTNQDEDNFDMWQSCVEKILEKMPVRSFTEYMKMSQDLFASSSFFKSNSYEFKTNSKLYIFEFDSVPRVIFPNLNISFYNTQRDSSVINNTKGVYYPLTAKFYGEGGKVSWAKAGLGDDVVKAELKKYQIQCKAGGYTADSAMFYHKEYFSSPLVGTITDKVTSETDKNITYPRFESSNKKNLIKNIVEGADYEGGFAMRGAKFVGSGSKGQDAKIIFSRNGKPFVFFSSQAFLITKDKVQAENAAMKIFIDKDSIYHTSLGFRYFSKDKKLTIIRADDGLAKTPIFNSFHQVDMFFDVIEWKTDEPKMAFKMLLGSTLTEATFESSNYYIQNRYDQLLGYGTTTHPLILIRDYSRSLGDVKEFSVVELARYMKIGPDQLRPFLITLANMGFIMFDPINDWVYMKERLETYIGARAKRLDYDALNIVSDPKGDDNASLNLLNYDLTIRGVNGILLSDTQQVYVYPSDKKVVLRKNRDFSFAGVVHAGKFDFFGKEFYFNYEQFKIDLVNVDSLMMKAESREADAYGQKTLVQVKTVIQKINGELLIDIPANKSGTKPYPKYPIFNSIKDSYVFYEKRNIQKGAYKKDDFYFHLDPFTIDSLDNFNNSRLRFDGDFVSAGIMPQFRETLTLQQDYSLGFIRNTPPEGIALYGGKAKFTNKITMSHKGLKGDGDIEFVNSLSKSKEFIFYPDSTNGVAQSFVNKEQKSKPEYPQAKGDSVYVHYMPKKDYMNVFSRQTPISCFNGQTELRGRFDITPKMNYAKGIMFFNGAELESNLMKLQSNKFDADTSNFRLKSTEEGAKQLALKTDNFNAHIDFDKRIGEFKSNGKGSYVTFPVNQYMCYMDNFKWFMDKSDIELGSSKGIVQKDTQGEELLNLEGPEFISLNPNQDSLRFVAPAAKFDFKRNIIYAKDVPYVNVADARIYPDSGRVVIFKQAVMDTLKHAKILANIVTKYHRVQDATVNIYAKKSYKGSGYYEYKDELKQKQSFYFSNISVDTSYATYAETVIPDSIKFNLSPNFAYQGKVKLLARNQFLFFDGATKISHTCDKVGRTWVKFAEQINPEQIYIPIKENLEGLGGEKVGAAVMVSTDSTHVYSAFMSPKYGRIDAEVLPAKGFLYFDKPTREYRIASKEKLQERTLPGNYLSLNTANCKIYGEGTLNFATDFGQVKMNSYGSVTHFLVPDSIMFETMMTLDFFFEDNIIEKMAEDINTYNLTATDFSKPNFEKGIREMVGKEQGDKLISQLSLYGSFKKFPDELKKTFFISDLKMKWNTTSKSYVSVGKIGLGSMLKTQIFKFVDGRVELVKKRGGDILNIYLQLDENNWYFFSYSRGLMQAISSNEKFNVAIKELKPEKRDMKTERGTPSYSFNISSLRKKNDFLKKTAGAPSTDEE